MSVIERIRAALGETDQAKAQLETLTHRYKVATESADRHQTLALDLSREISHLQTQLDQEYHPDRTKLNGLIERHAAAQQAAAADREACARLNVDIAQLQRFLATPESSEVRVTSEDLAALRRSLAEDQAAIAKVNEAINGERKKITDAEVVDKKPVEDAKRALQDLLADAIDDKDQTEAIAQATQHLKDAEQALAIQQTTAAQTIAMAQHTISGLERKRQQLLGEHQERHALATQAFAVFLQGEFIKTRQSYITAGQQLITAFSRCRALSLLAIQEKSRLPIRPFVGDPVTLDLPPPFPSNGEMAVSGLSATLDSVNAIVQRLTADYKAAGLM